MSIGQRISALRKEKGISQYQLARLMDVSRQAVSKWENDQNAPDTIKLIQLSDILDTQVEYLATGRISQSPSPSDPAPKIVEMEKIVEVERIVEKQIPIEKPVYIEKVVESVVEKPVIRKVYRIKYIRNPVEYIIMCIICLIIGFFIGKLI